VVTAHNRRAAAVAGRAGAAHGRPWEMPQRREAEGVARVRELGRGEGAKLENEMFFPLIGGIGG
jgi:hypothetical protein